MILHENYTVNCTCYANYIVVHREPLFYGSVKSAKAKIMADNRKTEYNGFMSPSTKRKVRTILTTWLNAVALYSAENSANFQLPKRKLTFVTLTLSDVQSHTDNEIKRKMLNRFITNCKRNFDVKYFFWRAEKQKSGRLHFHLIMDSYISKENLQNTWNDIQMDFNYLDKYFSKHKRYNAPSTHIKAVDSLDNAIDYVLKYVSKNPRNIDDKKLKVKGRIWGCSNELRELRPYSFGEDSAIMSQLVQMAKDEEIECLDADFFTVYRVDTSKFLKKYFKRYFYQMNAYYIDIYKNLYIRLKLKNLTFLDTIQANPIVKAEALQLKLPFDLNPAPVKRYTHFED